MQLPVSVPATLTGCVLPVAAFGAAVEEQLETVCLARSLGLALTPSLPPPGPCPGVLAAQTLCPTLEPLLTAHLPLAFTRATASSSFDGTAPPPHH